MIGDSARRRRRCQRSGSRRRDAADERDARRRADAVTLLLDRGAKIDATDTTYQQTALMVAVRENHPDIVKLLIARGASVNARTRVGRTPQWVLPNSVPGFGHGIGIVRGGLPDRGVAASDSGRHDAAAVRGARWPDGDRAHAARRAAPTSISPTPTASRR